MKLTVGQYNKVESIIKKTGVLVVAFATAVFICMLYTAITNPSAFNALK